MADTFEKDLLGQIICKKAGIYNFSADVLIGNVQQSTVRILCDTNEGDLIIQLPSILDFQNAYADLLIIIADMGNNAGVVPITVLTGGDTFQFQSGTGQIDKNGNYATLRVVGIVPDGDTPYGCWAVGGNGLTYGG